MLTRLHYFKKKLQMYPKFSGMTSLQYNLEIVFSGQEHLSSLHEIMVK